MTRLLYGVSATDPITFASIALVMAVVALVASWVPARRADHSALRFECDAYVLAMLMLKRA